MSFLQALRSNKTLFRLAITAVLLYSFWSIYNEQPGWSSISYAIPMLFFVFLLWRIIRLHAIIVVMVTLYLFTMALVNEYADADSTKYTLPFLWIWFSLMAVRSARSDRLAVALNLLTGALMLAISYEGTFPFSLLISLVSTYFGIHSLIRYISVNRINRDQLKELEKVHSELQNAHDELQENALQAVRYAALAERTRIAGEIHDGLGHHFTSIIVQLQALKWMVRQNPTQAEQTVEQLLDVSRQGLAEVRSVVKDWSTSEHTSDELRLLAAQVAERSGLQLTFHTEGDYGNWGEAVESILYRILQESLTNIVRHSGATEVNVDIREAADCALLTIADNGKYREAEPITQGFGVKNMIRRCKELQGDCQFLPTPGGGLTVRASLPLHINQLSVAGE
ncbi:sensor histidine kinase [Paenibacillus campi]|uniref:sensor histidine kinase n=1 Tax=Paenibacillus campi TaxID=3106031 RepID=UPI002AFEAE71|nr:sensor histidine kinase [Paenibacillus sp. SGZ-1014]